MTLEPINIFINLPSIFLGLLNTLSNIYLEFSISSSSYLDSLILSFPLSISLVSSPDILKNVQG